MPFLFGSPFGICICGMFPITIGISPDMGSGVRQVLSYVESGNVEAGFVYATDAKVSTKVKVVASAPADINVVYPVAVIKASKSTDAAQAYIQFLSSAKAKAIFEKYGFTPISN